MTKSSPQTALRSLVYWDKISCPWVQRFLSNKGVKEGYPSPSKIRYFAVIGSYSVKTVADRYTDMLLIITSSTADRLFRFIKIDDLERP